MSLIADPIPCNFMKSYRRSLKSTEYENPVVKSTVLERETRIFTIYEQVCQLEGE